MPEPAGSFGLEQLARQLRREQNIRQEVDGAVKASAKAIRDDWRRRMRARSIHGHIPHLPKAITYNTYRGVRIFSATIGVDKDKKQGPLGNLLEFGSVNNAPHNDGGRSLRAEEDVFVDRMQRIADDFL